MFIFLAILLDHLNAQEKHFGKYLLPDFFKYAKPQYGLINYKLKTHHLRKKLQNQIQNNIHILYLLKLQALKNQVNQFITL